MYVTRIRQSVVALWAMGLATYAIPAYATTVTIAFEGSYAPWNITNSDGTLGGFEPELAKILCDRAKLDCKLIAVDWDSMIPSLNAGKFDVIMDAMSITDDRKKAIDFSIPYAATRSRFVTSASGSLTPAQGESDIVILKAGEKGGEALEGLRKLFKGKTIGIQTATHYAQFITDNFGDICDVREYKTSPERDIDLENGRLDLIIDNTVYLTKAIDASKGALEFFGPTIAGTIWGEGVGLGIRKSNTDLRAAFDRAIESVREDGTLTKLSLQYLKTDVAPK
jgi:octopine/nopaline transport system substrate-binding protein